MEIKELIPNLNPGNWIEQYLNTYGIKDTQEYLYPTFKYVESPKVYDNMQEAYELLMESIKNHKNIGIVQDCDVDGILSAYLMYKTIHELTLPFSNSLFKDLQVYFHSDKKHGITENVIKWVLENDINLLIVPDAGSNDYIQQQDLNFLNVDIIILDHHKIEKNKSDYKSNYKTIVISNQQGWVKNKALSGTGVVSKFIKYIDMQEGSKTSAFFADLVALSLVSDMCDMTSQENRSFLLFGLSKINNPFFIYLLENFVYHKDDDGKLLINQYTLGFDICPYLNAVSRGKNQELKKELFYAFCGLVYQPDKTFKEYTSMEEYEPLLGRLKEERAYQDKMVDKALKDGEICVVLSCNMVSVLVIMILKDADIYPYTGLIANKLRRAHSCSAFVIHESLTESGKYTGSCRAEINTLKLCIESGLFELASGHDFAHGIIFKKDNLQAIKDYFANKCADQEEYKIPVVKTFLLDYEDIPKSLFGFADEWEFLWNSTFVKPIFNIDNIHVNSQDIQVIGKDKNVIKFKKDGIEFIKFKVTEDEKAELFLEEDKNLIINAICNLTKNEWHGRITLQAVIEIMEIDYKIDEEEPQKILTWEDVFG